MPNCSSESFLEAIAESLAGLATPRKMYRDSLFSKVLSILQCLLVLGLFLADSIPGGNGKGELMDKQYVSAGRRGRRKCDRCVVLYCGV